MTIPGGLGGHRIARPKPPRLPRGYFRKRKSTVDSANVSPPPGERTNGRRPGKSNARRRYVVEATAYRYNMGRLPTMYRYVVGRRPMLYRQKCIVLRLNRAGDAFEASGGLRRSSELGNHLRRRSRSKSDEVKISTRGHPTSRSWKGRGCRGPVSELYTFGGVRRRSRDTFVDG